MLKARRAGRDASTFGRYLHYIVGVVNYSNVCAGASFLAVSAAYTNFGSGYVAPSAAAKSGVEALMM